MCLYQIMMTLHFLNDVANATESNFFSKIENFVIIASLKRETMGKLINIITGSRLLISSLPGLALRLPTIVRIVNRFFLNKIHIHLSCV